MPTEAAHMKNKVLHALSNRPGPFHTEIFSSSPNFAPAILSASEKALRHKFRLDDESTDFYLKQYLALLHGFVDFDKQLQDRITTYRIEDFIPRGVRVDGADFLQSANTSGYFTDPLITTWPVNLNYLITYESNQFLWVDSLEDGIGQRTGYNFSDQDPHKVLRIDWPSNFPFTGPLRLNQNWISEASIKIEVEPSRLPWGILLKRVQDDPYVHRLLLNADLTGEFSNSVDPMEKVALVLMLLCFEQPWYDIVDDIVIPPDMSSVLSKPLVVTYATPILPVVPIEPEIPPVPNEPPVIVYLNVAGYVYDRTTSARLPGSLVTMGGASQVTDFVGGYNFRLTPGTYNASAAKVGYNTHTFPITVSVDTVRNIPMVMVKYVLSGNVYDSITLAHLEGVAIMIGSTLLSTDVNGSYAITLIPGIYAVTASKDEYTTHSGFVNVIGNTIYDISLVLITYVLSGTVSDSETHTPLEGVEVIVGSTTLSTDETGHYSIVVVPGNYAIAANKTGYTPYSGSVEVSSNTTKDIELEAVAVEIVVSGTVTDETTSALLSGVVVTLTGNTTHTVYTTSTDANGDYTKIVVADTYTITGVEDGYYDYSYANLLVDASLTYDFRMLAVGVVDIFGIVTGAFNGGVVSGITVTATRLLGDGTAIEIVKTAQTNSSGVYRISDVPVGNYTISTTDGSYNIWDDSLETPAFVSTLCLAYEYMPVVVGSVDDVEWNFSITPDFEGIRFVLNWGQDTVNETADLDLFIFTPAIDTHAYQLFYPESSEQSYHGNYRAADHAIPPYASHDVNSAHQSFDPVDAKPETGTIWRPSLTGGIVGTYQVKVFNWSAYKFGHAEFAALRPALKVYVRNYDGAISYNKTFAFPGGTGHWWHVLTMTCAIDGTIDIGEPTDSMHADGVYSPLSERIDGAGSLTFMAGNVGNYPGANLEYAPDGLYY